MKIGLCTIAFSELPLEDVLDIAGRYGFDGVEIWGKQPHTPSEYDEDYFRKIKEIADSKMLEIAAFGSYVNPLTDDYEQQMETALQITQILGSKLIRVWSGGGPSKSVRANDRRLITIRLKTVCQWAGINSITVATEMHNNNLTDTAETTLQLIQDVGLPGLKTYYQPCFRKDADDFYECAKLVGPYVANVHAQNAKQLDNGSFEACAIADGVVNYKKIVGILRSYDYDGYLEIEFVHGEDKLAALKNDRDFLAQLLK
ncbi:TPA: sugar phosphate isomerase/epimerase [Candidatus Poribacteria bacterium]|nr:sugar phosphate isomerase/epimerase [Candidatus Poribacteria bacterium]